jgi:hypothetical protein
MPASGHLATFAFVAAAVVVLLWPALLRGSPFLFQDTSAYVRAVDAAVSSTTGWTTEWTRPGEVERMSSPAHHNASPSQPQAAAAAKQVPLDQNRVPLIGRSFYYGVLAYASALTGSFWFLAVIHASVVALATLVFLACVNGTSIAEQRGRATALVLLLAAASTAPFFTSFMMPDIFTGVGILAAAMLMFPADSRRSFTLFWFGLAAASALFHASHILILLGLGALGAVVSLLQPSRSVWRRVALVFIAAIAGLAGEFTFSKAVEQATGAPPVRPPFITARLIDDGPGLRYLRENCDTEPLYLCQFVDRLPQHSDNFLWSSNPREGVFNTLNPAGKRKLAAEQGTFVRKVALAYPLDVIGSTAASAGRQLTLLRLSEFDPAEQAGVTGLPPSIAAAIVTSETGPDVLSADAFADLTTWVGLLALVSLPVLVWARLISGHVALIVVAGVLLNSVICGGLSTPHDRYGARVLWLLPLLAGAALLKLRQTGFGFRIGAEAEPSTRKA